MIFNKLTKQNLVVSLLAISVLLLLSFFSLLKNSSAAKPCCYHECKLTDPPKCNGNIIQICGNCDTDRYNDWCNSTDCSTLGQVCKQGVCQIPTPTCIDKDGDGYGNPASTACTHAQLDCDDSKSSIHPVNTEICDGYDNNCNGQTDENCDKDDDNYCDCSQPFTLGSNLAAVCSGTNTTDNFWWQNTCDCNDNDKNINRGASENCSNSIDDDCDNQIDCADTNCAGNLACCALSKTCADYPGQCGKNLSDGCANVLNCSGNCVAPKICCSGTCKNPLCSNNNDCNDSNNCTTDICNNSGTCTASCSNPAITVTCATGPGCRTAALTNASATGDTCCIGKTCYKCDAGYSWDGSACIAGCTPTCATGPGCRTVAIADAIVTADICCGTGESCYQCNTGYSWNGSSCVAGCTDTCASLGYECGTNTICGSPTNCGSCTAPEICNASGKCVAPFTASITSPSNGAEFKKGDVINFNSSVSGGTAPYTYSWTSAVDGSIGNTASFSRNDLSNNGLPYNITLKVTDSVGATATNVIKIAVYYPKAVITQPANGSSFVRITDTINFAAQNCDSKTPCTYVWTSSIDGNIGNVQTFSKNDLSSVSHIITLSVTDSFGQTAATNITINVVLGPIDRKVAVILINFLNDTTEPYTLAYARSAIFTASNSVNAYYQEASFGKLNLTSFNRADGDIYGWYTIPWDDTSSNLGGWATDAESAAKADGFVRTNYNNIIYIFPKASGLGSWAGGGTIGGNPAQAWINQPVSFIQTVSHELGHNFGAQHSNVRKCTDVSDNPVTISDTCIDSEYGDPFDTMATTLRHMNNYHKGNLNWYDAVNTQDVSADGDYAIAPLEWISSGVQALRVARNASEYYYLEYRQPFGFDNFNSTDPVVNGVSIRIASDYATLSKSYLLDATPGSASGFNDSALAVGKTFKDTASGITITTLSISATEAKVHVKFGP